MMDWFKTHWGAISIAAGILMSATVSVLYAGEEWKEYKNLKQAMTEQKHFVTEAKSDFADIKAQQARVDERTKMMLDMLKSIDARID